MLGRRAVRALAARHGIRPTKALGQNFMVDPNMARAVTSDAEVRTGDRVVEIGAGLGSLTVALAETGAAVRAIEFDGRLLGALEEVTRGLPNVELRLADALTMDLASLGGEPFTVCSNLPYNTAVPIVMRLLEEAPAAKEIVICAQRELGERMSASPAEDAYGGLSVRIAYHAHAELTRRVPRTVFWPEPKVDSVVVRLRRRQRPPVDTPPVRLWAVVDAAFAQRRKTMQNALRRMGCEAGRAGEVLETCGIDPRARPEVLSLQDFSNVAHALPDAIFR